MNVGVWIHIKRNPIDDWKERIYIESYESYAMVAKPYSELIILVVSFDNKKILIISERIS